MSSLPIKTVIIDDAPKAIHLLKLMMAELAPDEIEIVGEANNAKEGLQLIIQLQPDLVLLDIEMPGKSGIELAKEILEKSLNCKIVFTTAYNQYAIQAFRLAAVDYLLKPIQENELLEAIQKVKERIDIPDSNLTVVALTKNLITPDDQIITIPSNIGYEFIHVKDIMYLKADESYVHIHCHGGPPKIVAKNLKYFEQNLQDNSLFFRTHRTFLINLKYISTYSKTDRGVIKMKDGKTIDLARNRKNEFMKILENLTKR